MCCRWVCWSLIALLLAPLPARADLAAGLAALRKGEWTEAETQLRAATDGEKAAATLALAELKRLTGAYSEAIQLATEAAQQPAIRNDALTLLGDIEIEAGQHSQAIRHLTAALTANAKLTRARALLGIAYRQTGQLPQAQRHFQLLLDDYSAGRIDKKDASQLTAVGLACRYLEAWQDASGLFQDAAEVDPAFLPAHLELADLFLLKYNPAEAQESLEEVVKLNPNYPRALVGLARLALEQGNQVPKALELAEKCLKQNPRYADAFLVRARIQLDNAEFASAEADAQRALETNPNHLAALAILAASRYLQDDRPGYDSWRARAFRFNPKYADFYPFVAEFAERHHWYAECIDLNKQALAIDPNHVAALYSLGVAYLRTNNEKEGLAALRKAWDRDPFNVRNYNLLNLFEEIIPKQYESVASGPLLLRWNKVEGPVIGRSVDRLLRRAWDTYARKYAFAPKTPLTVELYTERDHFSVRTLGLPDLGAQGVCFGEMVTAVSPATGEANWEEVLWHETAHVFHLQLSRNRVSRWFTEGLAEYETNVARPEWRREHSREIFFALKRGDLGSVRDLNPAFTRPGRRNGVVIAYQQSSLVIHYLVETHGFDRIVQALKLYGQGKHDEEVLRTVTGQTIEQIDAGFRKWLVEHRFAHYEKGLLIDFDHLAASLDDVRARAEATPNAANLTNLAAAWYGRRNYDETIGAARRALAVESDHTPARYLLGLALVQTGKMTEAKVELSALLADGHDGYGLRLGLARLAREEKDLESFENHLREAKRLDPDQTAPFEELAELYESQGRAADALAQLAGVCRIREHSLDTARALLNKCLTLAQPERIADYAPLALAIHPAEPFILQQYGAALIKTRQYREAVPVLESAVAAAMKKSDVRGLLALAYLEAGDKARARAAAEATLKDDPGNPEARDVLKRLDAGSVEREG